ncbi:MAG: guanylate kinase [Calditrichaeota bacterium]|nr:guanylate kinase [Calditrichota bacterium]
MQNQESQNHSKTGKPQLVVISAPSGAGKTTICKILAERNPDFRISISATTRPPRKTETDGVDYFFISEEEFLKRVEAGEFLEYENVHGHYYGTLRKNVESLLKQGFTVLFDIDVNGAIKIKKQFPEAILIFIRPPSLEELKKRLRERQTEDPQEIERRLQRLPEEYAKAVLFDYDIVNDDLMATVAQIEDIIRTHQRKEQDHVSN